MSAFKVELSKRTAEKTKRMEGKGVLSRVPKAMVVGIPNVGKSAFINCLAGTAGARTADKPGVTRGKQWIRIEDEMDLLDMPGVLQPRFEDVCQARHLAYTGAIRDEVTDPVEIASLLLEELAAARPDLLSARYKIQPDGAEGGYALLERCAKARGFLMSGGRIDANRMAAVLLDEYREGRIGRITLETP
jgi:ribosome biogenesis GTPase A